jgi:hypothetical protein
MLASQLATQCVFVAGAVLDYAEVTRRIAAQQEAIRALGLAVPSHVRIADKQLPELVVERLWV